ncbi:MAG: RsmB/NOP family class I SAM-dependent RNA methyltransferase [Clostridiales bacterium]|jgi:NOL1/NOP2/sun family putative RNA methylase|nr:RsmB/NOP family class I SAM-dependent RNA methyltransferase [Clostridiales bacterium]
MNLPESFTSKMFEYFPEEAEGLIEALNQPKERACRGIRANTLKIAPGELAALLSPYADLSPVPWCAEGFYCAERERLSKTPFYAAGLFYIQEPSAQAPAAALEIRPGEAILDLCAAPGGKSTHLAGKLAGGGLIVANDVSNSRARALLKNLELAGVKNAAVLNETPARIAERLPEFFDKIIIDAPCSGEGMFRKEPAARAAYDGHKSEQMAAAQKEILFYADKALRPGGRIMYSTCTFSPLENEMIIGDFLSKRGDYELIPLRPPGFRAAENMPGLPETAGAARLFPHRAEGEGHFMACLKKSGEGERAADSSRPAKIPDIELFYKFAEENLKITFNESNLAAHKGSVYLRPAGLPDLSRLRVIREGLYLGDIKKNRFEPSQALAMSLKKAEAARVLDFAPEDETAARYLRGESFPAEAGDGWALVCVCGFPLGFCKVKAGRAKNKYLKGWIN